MPPSRRVFQILEQELAADQFDKLFLLLDDFTVFFPRYVAGC